MRTSWLSALVPTLLIGTAGCPDVKVDPGEGVDDEPASGPIAEFDPSNRIIPFPNNLLLDPMTGKVNVPASCNESAASMATRVGVLNQLDGFGTFETSLTVTFTAPVDAASLDGNVLLYKRAVGATPLDPSTATPVPVVTLPSMTARFAADCAGAPTMVDQLVIVPRVPLDQKSVYVVALTDGITAGGEPVGPSFTWAIVRQESNPVGIDENGTVTVNRTPLDPRDAADLAQLQGINLLWLAHAQAMSFIRGTGVATEDVILAWEFKTQTVTDPLDPTVPGSPASQVNTMPLTGPVDAVPVPVSIVGVAANRGALPFSACGADTTAVPNVQCYLRLALGGGLTCNSQSTCDMAFAAGTTTCTAVGCAAVGDIMAGRVRAKQFQTLRPNAAVPARMIPGPWSNPLTPTVSTEELVTAVIVLPAAGAPPEGRQVVVYQHGLGSNKETVLAIAPQLAAQGFATVSIDAVAHGSRAVQTSTDAALGCGGTPPLTSAQCYAGFLSPDLGTTRDNIRQTVVDHLSLISALKQCTGTACGGFTVDPAHIEYAGISLGGIIGNITTAVSPDIQASVLNVPGVGWFDILENTETLAIRCTLVNGLIQAGVLMGDLWTGGNTGLCTTDAWKAQAGYRQFSAIGRWILDPADPANFTRQLAAKRFLIQEVVGDTVVPNVATRNEGALVGLMPAAAACPAAPPMPPSPAITTMPNANKWLQYTTADAATCPPAGAIYAHSSLLAPAGGGTAGQLATARMQTDAITFLVLNR